MLRCGCGSLLRSPGGVFLGIPGGGVLPVLQFLILVQTKNWHFSYLFSDLASKKFCHHYLDQKSNKKRFLKIHFIVAHFSFFLPHLELKRQIRLYTLADPWKTIPISHQNDAETLPFRAVHTYMAYIREYPRPQV